MSLELIQFTGTDPIANLAMEEYLARHREKSAIQVLIYRNEPAVVIGRNQNPWRECNPTVLKDLGIPLIRRISGGGTVYHDLGNLNYAFILPRVQYAPERHADTVCRALHEVGVEAERSDRNDILLGEHKISGTAYMLSGKLALHHGTLLIDTDLEMLRKALAPAPDWTIETKAIASVRAKVANVAEAVPTFTVDRFVDALADELKKESGELLKRNLDTTPDRLSEEVYELMTKHTDPEWVFGRTPAFSAEFAISAGKTVCLQVKGGRVVESDPAGWNIGDWFKSEILEP